MGAGTRAGRTNDLVTGGDCGGLVVSGGGWGGVGLV